MEVKRYETRSWGTDYRGRLLICAAKKKSSEQKYAWTYLRNKHFANEQKTFESLPFGCAIALVNLVDCIQMTPN
jgi:hypothetical protein